MKNVGKRRHGRYRKYRSKEPYRKELKKVGAEERHRYSGRFGRFGSKTGWNGPVLTVLILDVVEIDTGKKVTDHLWFNATKGFREAEPREGDILEFDARVTRYVKGYCEHDRYGDNIKDHTKVDYKLSFPTKIVNVTREEWNSGLIPLMEIPGKEKDLPVAVPKAKRH